MRRRRRLVVLRRRERGPWWLVRPAPERRRAVGVLLFFGPLWWVIGVAPIAVAGYESPRHVYLAAAGWAIVLGILRDLAWARARSVGVRRLAQRWRWRGRVLRSRAASRSREWNRMAAVSHKVVRDVRAEALSCAAGQPDRHRRADAELGVGAAVLRSARLIRASI